MEEIPILDDILHYPEDENSVKPPPYAKPFMATTFRTGLLNS